MTEKLDAPPHPKPSLRFGFDLSRKRGEVKQADSAARRANH
jgi:hypothetical protein